MTVDELLEELEHLSARGLGELELYFADGGPYLTLLESCSIGRPLGGGPCVVMNEGAAPGDAVQVPCAYPPPPGEAMNDAEGPADLGPGAGRVEP